MQKGGNKKFQLSEDAQALDRKSCMETKTILPSGLRARYPEGKTPQAFDCA